MKKKKAALATAEHQRQHQWYFEHFWEIHKNLFLDNELARILHPSINTIQTKNNARYWELMLLMMMTMMVIIMMSLCMSN